MDVIIVRVEIVSSCAKFIVFSCQRFNIIQRRAVKQVYFEDEIRCSPKNFPIDVFNNCIKVLEIAFSIPFYLPI